VHRKKSNVTADSASASASSSDDSLRLKCTPSTNAALSECSTNVTSSDYSSESPTMFHSTLNAIQFIDDEDECADVFIVDADDEHTVS